MNRKEVVNNKLKSKIMKNLIIISIVSALTIMSSCSKDEQIFGSGKIVSELRNVNEFT